MQTIELVAPSGDDEAIDVLYDLVNEVINRQPKVYSQVQKKLRNSKG